MSLETTANKFTRRPRHADLKAHGQGRSRVSNGKDILPDCDGRSIVARRYRDISSAMIQDQGGPEQCSESRLQLIRRFSASAVLAEQMEARLANGEDISIAEHCQLASTMVRIAHRLGINRIPKDLSLSDPAIAIYEQELARLEAEDEQEDASP